MNGNFIENILEYYKKCLYVYDKFLEIMVCTEISDTVILKIKAFEDSFVK